MTVTLHLRHEIESSLLARAHANGVQLEAYLYSLVEEAAAYPASTDAAYLDLALRTDLALTTSDEPLRQAAIAQGITVLAYSP